MTNGETRVLWIAAASIGLVFFLYLTSKFSAQPGDLLKGLADLVRAIAWPAVVAFLLIAFRTPIADQFGRISKIDGAGVSIVLNPAIAKELQVSTAETLALPVSESGHVTASDISRATVISGIATEDDLPGIRARMIELAAEYQRIRSVMSPSNERTRAMSVVVGQMRALGQVAYQLRGEFAFSSEPGQRLAALVIAQISPDIAMTGWIASCVSPTESWFIQFHALQALLIAARSADASQFALLDQAYWICKAIYDRASPDKRTDRPELIEAIANTIAARVRPAAVENPGSAGS